MGNQQGGQLIVATRQSQNGSKRVYQVPKWTRSDQGSEMTFTLYHGTTIKAAASIASQKMIRPSKDGRIGPGIYFVNDQETAIKIGTHRSIQSLSLGCDLLTCKIKVKEKYLRRGRHPKWPDVCEPFDEFCVQKGQVTISNLFIIGMITPVHAIVGSFNL